MAKHLAHGLLIEVKGKVFGRSGCGGDIEDIEDAQPEAQAGINECTHIYSHAYQYTQQSVSPSVMLIEEDEHGIIEDVHISETALYRALALVMQDGERQIPVLPSSL